MKKCPYCAEEIQDEAIICRYCHSDLRVPIQPPPAPVQPASAQTAPTPAPVQPASAQTAPSPAPVQPEPAQTAPTPAPVQPEPVQTVPAQTTPTPAPVQQAPAQTAPAPAPVQQAPAQTAPAPAPVQPEPAQTAPTPAPVQPEPAQTAPAQTAPPPAPVQQAPAQTAPPPAPPRPPQPTYQQQTYQQSTYQQPTYRQQQVSAAEYARNGAKSLLKYIGFVLPLIMAIGIFIPVFVFPNIRDTVNTVNYWGSYITGNSNSVKLDAELSQVDFAAAFGTWTEYLGAAKIGWVIALPYAGFAILLLIAGVYYYRAVTRFREDVAESFDLARKSIMMLLFMNIESLIVYVLFVAMLSSAGNRGSSDMSDYITRAVLEVIKMDFPVSALIFGVLDCVSMRILGNASDNWRYDSRRAGGSSSGASRSGEWTCPKCGTINSPASRFCMNCDQKRLGNPTTATQTSDGKWICPRCGRKNSKILDTCVECNCPKPNSSASKQAANTGGTCRYCGTKVNADAAFCPECGRRISS